MCSKIFMTVVPSSASMRSNSQMCRNRRRHTFAGSSERTLTATTSS